MTYAIPLKSLAWLMTDSIERYAAEKVVCLSFSVGYLGRF